MCGFPVKIFVRSMTNTDKYICLINSLSDGCARKITSCVSPNDPDAFIKSVELLRRCYRRPKPSCVEAQRKFSSRLQKDDENLYLYAAELST